MPVGIKDLLETRDMPTEMGCAAMKGNFPKRDNAGVWALRQAGAVILAKTVTAELGGSHPGPTTNPFDHARTPGGSSSGSAAAVGANMVPAAIGTQVGGSIIRPAAYCGNFALKHAGHQSRRAAGDQHEHAWPACQQPRGHGRSRSRWPSAAAAIAVRSG
jgi:Asp-tRNA(Asn)/Glu-tRNA(Gln) amidotransferase A subunit family amidase